jgi:excisionase family DNA binding protein
MPEYLTVEEVATMTRLSPSTIRWYRQVGKGPRSFKLGRRVAFRRADVEAWIEQQYAAAGDNA